MLRHIDLTLLGTKVWGGVSLRERSWQGHREMTKDLKSWALHPRRLTDPVAMEISETVYLTLMWLGARGSGQVMKPVGLPLFPDSTPNRVPTASTAKVAGNLTSVLLGPAHHSPLEWSPHVC